MIGRGYKQTATYWGAPVPDGTGGFDYAAPETLLVRWEERQEQFTDQVGDLKVSKAVVFVPEDVEAGGYLYLGTSVATDPGSVEGAFKIHQFAKVPDLRNALCERRAYL